MPAGALTERVVFEAPTSVADGYGGTVGAHAAQFTVAAGYIRLRGGEAVLASRLAGRQPTVIRVRASPDTRAVTPAWRARDARTDEPFNIRAIALTPDRAYLEMTCESGVAT